MPQRHGRSYGRTDGQTTSRSNTAWYLLITSRGKNEIMFLSYGKIWTKFEDMYYKSREMWDEKGCEILPHITTCWSFCPPICLSRSGSVSKRLSWSKFFHRQLFATNSSYEIPTGYPMTGSLNTGGYRSLTWALTKLHTSFDYGAISNVDDVLLISRGR